MKGKSVIVVLSGGQDSVTCLFYAIAAGYTVHAFTIDYGQRHQCEIEAALTVVRLINSGALIEGTVATHEVLRLGHVLKGTSPLVSDSSPAQYPDHASLPGGLEATFVPMRNQLFLTLAANRAYCLGSNIVFTGVSAEDFGGYPDCREDFITSFEEASTLGTFTDEAGFIHGLSVQVPLMHRTKADTVKLALDLPGCYEALAFSHTAYDGQYPPLGHDHANLLRIKGFEEAGVPDPLVIRASLEGRMTLPKTENYAPTHKVNNFIKRVQRAMNIVASFGDELLREGRA